MLCQWFVQLRNKEVDLHIFHPETLPVVDIKNKGKRAQSDTTQSGPDNKRARLVCDGSESRVS